MTKEEAKKRIKKLLRWYLKEEPMSETMYMREAVNMATEALSAKPQGDLISREAVLELTKIISEDYSRERDSFRHFIEKLPPVEPQEWISVKDRLPEKNDCYLVTFNFESNGNPDNGIGVVEFYDGNFYSNGFGVNEDVAAWYSNPVPPSPYRREE